jgi:hypothetical protein
MRGSIEAMSEAVPKNDGSRRFFGQAQIDQAITHGLEARADDQASDHLAAPGAGAHAGPPGGSYRLSAGPAGGSYRLSAGADA